METKDMPCHEKLRFVCIWSLQRTMAAVWFMLAISQSAQSQVNKNNVPSAQRKQDPVHIAAAARKSAATITAIDRDGAVLSEGSGFFIKGNGTLVTNYHVIEGAETLQITTQTGETFESNFILATDARRDIAVLQVPIDDVPFLRISPTTAYSVGARVYVVGNPLGLEGTFSDGLISGLRMVEGTQLIQITAPISPGSSGGPVLDEHGEVIGIATLTMADGQNLNMALPAKYIAPLLRLNLEPVKFSARAAPARNDRKVAPSRQEISTFVAVNDPSGTYRIELIPSAGTPATVRGRGVIMLDKGRFEINGWLRSSDSNVEEFHSPITVTRDGKVAARIFTEMEGGFIDQGRIALVKPGHKIQPGVPAIFLTSNADSALISAPEGVYTVDGRGGYLSGNGNTIRWTGFVGILETDMVHKNGRGRLVAIYFSLNNSSGGSRAFTTTAAITATGEMVVDDPTWGADEPDPFTDKITAALSGGQIELTIDRKHHKRGDRFLDGRVSVSGGKIRS